MHQDVQISKKLFNVDDYYKMGESGILKDDARVELINGEVFSKSPISSFHSGVINLITRKLLSALGDKANISIQNPIRLNEYSEPEPDIAVAKFKKDAYRKSHPTPKDIFFLIEVADSSLNFDRVIKAPLYAKSGIPEYWIVNIPEQQVEIYSKPVNGEYLNRYIAKIGDTAKAQAINFQLEVALLFD